MNELGVIIGRFQPCQGHVEGLFSRVQHCEKVIVLQGSAGRHGWQGVLNAWDHISKLRQREDYETKQLRELIGEDDAPGGNYEDN